MFSSIDHSSYPLHNCCNTTVRRQRPNPTNTTPANFYPSEIDSILHSQRPYFRLIYIQITPLDSLNHTELDSFLFPIQPLLIFRAKGDLCSTRDLTYRTFVATTTHPSLPAQDYKCTHCNNAEGASAYIYCTVE